MKALREQIAFLEASAASFDVGFEGEAKRLATTLRVLVHDTSASQSLLSLLKLKTAVNYRDTAFPIYPQNLAATVGLAQIEVTTGPGGGAKYHAPLDDLPPLRLQSPAKPFAAWWTDPVTKDTTGALFSRRDYVLNLANKEGGAHVDPKLSGRWAALTRKNTLGWFASVEPGADVPLDSPALASVRQISHEFLTSAQVDLVHVL